jgi:hypothetical protein
MKSTSKLAVICACNPGNNNGMYSVDRAARHALEALGLRYDLCVTQGHRGMGALRYRLIRAPSDLLGYRAVLYWGDFLNNPMYGRYDYAQRERAAARKRVTLEDGFAHWRRMYLELGAELPASTPILAMGGCFIGAQSQLHDPVVLRSMRAFLNRCAAVVVRDSDSFELVSSLQATNASIRLGFDGASVLPCREPAGKRGGYFAHSFGRSLPDDQVDELVRNVERRTGLKGVRVDWLVKRWPKRVTHTNFSMSLALMRHARFCLTDTYHFAINSMRQGSLPICVVRDDYAHATTLNERKKRVLYRMVDLESAMLPMKGRPMEPVAPDDLRDAAEVVAALVPSLAGSLEWRDGFRAQQQGMQEQFRRLLS